MRARVGVLVIAIGIMLVALPAAAGADEFRGTTVQGKPVLLRTNEAGQLRRFRIHWRTSDCSAPYRLKTGSTDFIPPYDRSTSRRFVDEGQYRGEVAHARLRYHVRLTGILLSEGRWGGTFSAKVWVKLDSGERFTCEQDRLRWRAHA